MTPTAKKTPLPAPRGQPTVNPTSSAPRAAQPPRGRGTRKRTAWIIAAVAVALLALALGLWALARHAQATLEALKYSDIVTVSRGTIEKKVSSSGKVVANLEVDIKCRAGGEIIKLPFDISQSVKQGDLLCQLDTKDEDLAVRSAVASVDQAEAKLAQAKANLEIARISSERWLKLRESDSVSQQDTDVRVATWHAQEANVTAAEANVQRLTELTKFKLLTAPFPGIITARTMDAGTLITAGSSREIFRVARIDPLRVYLSLPQAYSQMVKTNDKATLTFSELPGQSFTGWVDRTAGAIDPISRTLLTELLVTNHNGILFPGAHTMVRVNLATGVNPVVVPVNTLLFRNELGVQVGLVDSNGIVRLADVTVGRDYGTTVEIVHGLSETDNVIINPSDSLEAGSKVRVAKPETEAAKSAHE